MRTTICRLSCGGVSEGVGTDGTGVLPSFHTETRDFSVCTTLLPDVDVTGRNRPALFGVEAASDHGEDMAGDSVK